MAREPRKEFDDARPHVEFDATLAIDAEREAELLHSDITRVGELFRSDRMIGHVTEFGPGVVEAPDARDLPGEIDGVVDVKVPAEHEDLDEPEPVGAIPIATALVRIGVAVGLVTLFVDGEPGLSESVLQQRSRAEDGFGDDPTPRLLPLHHPPARLLEIDRILDACQSDDPQGDHVVHPEQVVEQAIAGGPIIEYERFLDDHDAEERHRSLRNPRARRRDGYGYGAHQQDGGANEDAGMLHQRQGE